TEDESGVKEDTYPTAKRKAEESQPGFERTKQIRNRWANREEVYTRQQTPPREAQQHTDEIPLVKDLEALFHHSDDTSRFKLSDDDQVLYNETVNWFKTKIRRDTETTIQELLNEL
ncbi:hypothetical protein BGX27_005384, partial [Mortierella sp. AM989]